MTRSRRRLAAAGAAIIVLGIFSKLFVPGVIGDLLGDACYTALLFVVAAVVAPRAPGVPLAAVAFFLSAVVECLQLTPLPADAASSVPLSRWVLGSTFAWPDFLGYAAGASVLSLLDRTFRRREAE